MSITPNPLDNSTVDHLTLEQVLTGRLLREGGPFGRRKRDGSHQSADYEQIEVARDGEDLIVEVLGSDDDWQTSKITARFRITAEQVV